MNSDLDIAIVGMSGRFPGAANVDQFWRNLSEGVESITRLSDRDILQSGVPREYLEKPNYVKAAPILDEPGHFDAGFFGFSPMEARTMDPQHRILLELAHEALENAGYDPDRYQGHIGVFTGSAMNTYFMSSGLNSRFAEDYIPTLIVNDKDFLSTRISYKLNLKGPSITIQTACSTSLVAIHLARQSLLTEETDMALAGAVSLRVPHQAGYFCDGGGVVSPDGRVRAFDATANGTVFGSGGGILVLKRLADAVAAGDTIHAVIKGSAVNNDGSEKAGYTAPSVNRQADLVVEALANAGVDAESISYIEAHGSGTPLGDPIEIRALTKAFRSSTQRSGFCAIGSVKTNVGHLDAAAGVAGVIKTVLALEHRKLPASLNFSRPNPEIDFASTPFYVNTHLRSWSSDGPRRAGVMSTGMGGTNAHLVLEEAPEAAPMTDSTPPFLLILSAKTTTALDQATHRLGDFLIGHDMVSLNEVAYTLQVGRKAFPHRRYLVCSDRQDAVTALGEDNSKRVLSGRIDESVRRPVIFLFPGVGDHYVGMAHDLYERWDVFRQGVDRCSKILEPHLGIDIRSILYPDSKSWINQRQGSGVDLRRMLGRSAEALECQDTKTLNTTLYAQPALFTVEYALACLWQSLGITPDAIVGHSMGEYVAACLAGVLSLEDALRLITARAKLVNELPQGAMLAVMLTEAELRPLLSEQLSISLVNGPSVCVVAGPVAAVGEFRKALDEKGVLWRHVQNAHAFHSKMLDPIVKTFEEEVNKVRLSEPKIPYISNVTGTWITTAEATSPTYWATHTNHTARFNDALHELWQFKNAILVEAGPGRTLSVLATQHPDRRNADSPVVVSSIGHHYESQPDSAFLLEGIGRLWLAGVDIEWDHLHPGGRGRRVALPTYPFERREYWTKVKSRGVAQPFERDLPPGNSSVDDWFHVPTWERTPFPNEISKESHLVNAAWLIVGDRHGAGACFKARLDELGLRPGIVRFGDEFVRRLDGSFELNPAGLDDWLRLFRELEGKLGGAINIIHLGGLTKDHDGTSRASNQNFGFYSLLHMAQAIGELNIAVPIKIAIISNRIHGVTGGEHLNPEMATMLGPCGVIPKELPNITCFNVDLPDSEASESVPAPTVARILREFSEPHQSQVVAYRGGYRWERKYKQVKLPKTALSITPKGSVEPGCLRRGGVYLITGGTGGIGLAIAKYLAKTYQAKIVLTKKAAFPDKSKWRKALTAGETSALTRETIKALLEIESLGAEVDVLVADASDRDQTRKALDETLAKFQTINGVIHAAGIVRPGLIQAKSRETAESVLAPKVYGTMILFDLLKEVDLDFLVLFSSVTSIITPYAECDYSAANAFLDAFADFANAQKRFRTLTLNWSGWKEVGQLADLETLPGLETWKEAALKTAITTADGLEAFRRALNSDLNQVAISPRHLDDLLEESQVPFDPAKYLSRISNDKEIVSHRRRDNQQWDPPTNEVEKAVAEMWLYVFGVTHIGINEQFADLGGHSLLAMQIVARIRSAYQIQFTLRDFFETPTIAQLSSTIRARIVADIANLTDAEVRRLTLSDSAR